MDNSWVGKDAGDQNVRRDYAMFARDLKFEKLAARLTDWNRVVSALSNDVHAHIGGAFHFSLQPY
jgi:hypothetical protein